ncbi:MAG: hypothetical protein PVF55_06830, partial [Desulfobacterales bacterium]
DIVVPIACSAPVGKSAPAVGGEAPHRALKQQLGVRPCRGPKREVIDAEPIPSRRACGFNY